MNAIPFKKVVEELCKWVVAHPIRLALYMTFAKFFFDIIKEFLTIAPG